MLGQKTPPEPGSHQIFVGRASEIALLRTALDDARSGRGRLVLLSGPPGIGKSRLAAEFTGLMADEGVLTMIGRSWEAGGAPAYWPWVQAIRSYMRSADPQVVDRQIGSGLGEIATLLPELADSKPDVPLPIATEPAADRFRLFDALATFLRSVAEDEPLIMVLDDLQAADIPSLLLLRFVADQLAVTRILVVATYRDVELTPDHALASTLAELHRAPVTTSLALAGLDVAEVTRFLEAASGTSNLASVAPTLHRQTSGNPLFLGEALRLLKSSGGEQVTSTVTRMIVPAEIRALIERRLAGLGPDAREYLEVASVFGNEFDVDSIRRYQGVSVEEILDLFGEAVAAGLMLEVSGGRARLRFSHDLIRHTLYTGLAPARRVRLHRQAAVILEEVYGDKVEEHLAELALHHFEAAPGGDAAPAVDFGRRAGDQALRTLAYEEAGRLFEMAIEALEGVTSGDLSEIVDLHLSLGDARVRAGDLPGAGEAFWRAAEIARRLPDARRLAQAAVGYGGRFVWARAGGDQRMVPLLQDALVLLGGEDDRLRVRLMSRLACALRSSADREYCDALSGQALDLARQIDDPLTLIFALTGRAGAVWWPENPEERLGIGAELVSIGETSGSIEGIVDGHMLRCMALAEMGDTGAARRELETLSRTGGLVRMVAYRWLDVAMRTSFALLEGSLDEVEPWVEEMLAQTPTTRARDNVSGALLQLFILRREQGRLSELEETIRRAAVEFPWYPMHRIALAILLATGGQHVEARQILGDLSTNRFGALHRDNFWIPSLCLVAELAVELGEGSIATVMYELLEPYAARNAFTFAEGPLGSVARYLGLLADMLDDPEAADQYLEAAESANRKMGARPWLAHTLYDRAQLLIRRDMPGDTDQAASLL
ncbi:MAG TPA: AAA family ATPase, partial [Acidimicrobiia bacterium]|nr:AAA family ATPase [Acidimicrobiia bacterium]